MNNIIKLVVSCVRIVLLLIPALKCLPRPSVKELVKVAKWVLPYLRKLKLGKVDLVEVNKVLVKVIAFLEKHQELLVRVAKLSSSLLTFVKRVIEMIKSRLFKLVKTVAAKTHSAVRTVVRVLNTKLW